MAGPVEQDPRPLNTFFSTLPSPLHSLIPDVAAGGRNDGEAVGLPPWYGEDSRLCMGEHSSGLDTMTGKIQTQRRKKVSGLLQDKTQTSMPATWLVGLFFAGQLHSDFSNVVLSFVSRTRPS